MSTVGQSMQARTALVVSQSRISNLACRWVQEERGLMAGVLSLLDAVPFLAAKGLIAVALLSRATHKFLAHAVKSRLLHQV